MKKNLFIFLFVLLIPEAYAQSIGDMNGNSNSNGTQICFEKNKEKGYFNITQFSLLMGNQLVTERNFYYYPYPSSLYLSSSYIYPYPYNVYRTRNELQISPSVTMTNGYRFNDHWAAGIGVGFEIFNHYLFPVFADVRYFVRNDRISPFFALKTGYAFGSFKKKHYDYLSLDLHPYDVTNVDVNYCGGLMVHPEIGFKVILSHNADVLFSVAYRLQQTKTKIAQKYDYSPYYNNWELKECLSRMSLGVAILFK